MEGRIQFWKLFTLIDNDRNGKKGFGEEECNRNSLVNYWVQFWNWKVHRTNVMYLRHERSFSEKLTKYLRLLYIGKPIKFCIAKIQLTSNFISLLANMCKVNIICYGYQDIKSVNFVILIWNAPYFTNFFS